MEATITIKDLQDILKSAKDYVKRHKKEALPCITIESVKRQKEYGESDTFRICVLSSETKGGTTVIKYLNF